MHIYQIGVGCCCVFVLYFPLALSLSLSLSQNQQNSPKVSRKEKVNDKECMILLLLAHAGAVRRLTASSLEGENCNIKQKCNTKGLLKCFSL